MFKPVGIHSARAVLRRPLAIPGTKRQLPSRLVYQPMEINCAGDGGRPSGRDFQIMELQFKGRPGINWLQATSVLPEGSGRVHQWLMNEENLVTFQRIPELHQQHNPEGILLIQFTHSGWFALEPVTPYQVPERPNMRLLTDRDMEILQDRFVAAFQMAEQAGFHGAELKGCHGYLMGKMLNRGNQKRDGWSWGGPSLAERMSFYSETIEKIKKALVHPEDFILALRFSMYHGLLDEFGSLLGSAKEDTTHSEAKQLVEKALQLGIKIINVSAGVPAQTPLTVRPTPKNPDGVFNHFRWTEAVKSWVGDRALVVGSAYSYLRDGKNKLPGEIEFEKSFLYWAAYNIANGRTDAVGWGRQILADPLIAAKILGERLTPIDWCVACGGCSLLLRSQENVGCTMHDDFARETLRLAREAERIED